MAKEYKLSPERLKELQEEMNYLKTVREKEVAELIKEARSFGDLSENSEYDEAKNEQGKLYSRIAQLEEILSRVEGAGEVAVLLTESRGGEIFYQTEGDDQRTVLVTGTDRSESGLVRTTQSPVYQGAVVVCQGADSPAVRLAVVEAVSNATGLGTDRITVLKME